MVELITVLIFEIVFVDEVGFRYEHYGRYCCCFRRILVRICVELDRLAFQRAMRLGFILRRGILVYP